MSLSKKTRFEIFKRDGFTCQYCGQRPPEVVLEVDHIHPSSKGGSDEELNLITSCFDCNRGKSDRKLGEIHPRPDADIKYLETQQEIGEAKRYLSTQDELTEIRKKIKERKKTPSVCSFRLFCSTFGVECSMFDVRINLQMRGVRINLTM